MSAPSDTSTTDLVARLRDHHVGDPVTIAARLYDLCGDAADEIERLRAEVAHRESVMQQMWRAARRTMSEGLSS